MDDVWRRRDPSPTKSKKGDILGFPRPLLVAMLAMEVVFKGLRGETDRTRSALTASLNVVMGGR